MKLNHDVISPSCPTKTKVICQKGLIGMASPPNSSFVFTRWENKTDGLAAICNNCIFLAGGLTSNALGQGHHLIMHRWTSQLAPKSVERFKHDAWMWQMTEGQATQKCVRIGGLACAATTILPNKKLTSKRTPHGSKVRPKLIKRPSVC